MSQDIGVMSPPKGVDPDFDGMSDLQETVIIVFSVTFFVATLFCALRLYCAAIITRRFDWDIPIPYGFGKHIWNVRLKNMLTYMDFVLALCLTYLWPPVFAKLAILALYYRLIPNKRFHYTIYAFVAALLISTILFTVLITVPCKPVYGLNGTCDVKLMTAQGVLNIASDVILIVLPIPIIYKLKLPLKQRITAILLLTLGSGVIIVSCIRFGYVQVMQENPDNTWIQAYAALWSCIEMNVAIICNCLAHLAPFVRRHLPLLKKFVARGTPNDKGDSVEPGRGASHKQWGRDQTSYGYRLHSIDRQQATPAELESGIVVVEEFSVDFTLGKKARPASSTEI
ncbi:Puromycin-sensitive aminopeptidase [Fusarium austroafricanum]|uniref:Puromycin-sensitive aminopeptidase n=1 Tax=Fusarium austroafricanum TaxID=2364996 RepID=A0A8H4KVZ4_9HYPO|nr:Puromycin-sensitive aminopeptidase [Fusarium austroafricanum]